MSIPKKTNLFSLQRLGGKKSHKEGNLYLLCILSLFTNLVSILFFGWRWNEWMCGGLPWRKIEFWWSLIHIFLMITASVISLIALDTLTVTVYGLKHTFFKAEVIAIGVICFLGEFLK